MGIGVSIFLIAVGAILAFAVHAANTGPVDLATVGWILMIVGALGALFSMVFWSSWGGVGVARRAPYVETRRDTYVEQDAIRR